MPRDGAWNMCVSGFTGPRYWPDKLSNRIQKKFYQPSSVKGWVVVIYEPRFNDQAAQSMVQGLVQTCGETGRHSFFVLLAFVILNKKHKGVVFQDQQPPIIRQNGQGNIGDVSRRRLYHSSSFWWFGGSFVATEASWHGSISDQRVSTRSHRGGITTRERWHISSN